MEKEKYSEHELAMWGYQQKLARAAGELTGIQIRKLEAIPGWTWKFTEQEEKYRAEYWRSQQ